MITFVTSCLLSCTPSTLLILSFKEGPFHKGDKTILKVLSALKVYQSVSEFPYEQTFTYISRVTRFFMFISGSAWSRCILDRGTWPLETTDCHDVSGMYA